MNGGQLREAVYARVGVPTTDPLLAPAIVSGFVNDAANAVETERDWPWLITTATLTTVAGTDTYTPTAGWRKTIELKIPNYRPITIQGPIGADSDFPDTTRGRPLIAAIRAEQIVLRPIPDQVYSITHTFVRSEPDLAADNEVPLLPASFHPAIVEYASALCFRRLRQPNEAAIAVAEYDRWMVRLRDDVTRVGTRGRLSARVRPGGFL